MLEFFYLLALLGLIGLHLIGPILIITVGGVFVLEKLIRVPPEQRMPPLSKWHVLAFVVLCIASAVTWSFSYVWHPYLRFVIIVAALGLTATAVMGALMGITHIRTP